MSGPALFLAGVGVTVLVLSALALLVWGAILDGRDQAEARQRELARARQPRTETNLRVLTDRVPVDAA